MTTSGFLPEADAREAEAFTRARRSWIAAECAELQRHRAQQLGCSDRITPSFCEVSVDPVRGHLADAGLCLLQGQNKGREGGLEGLNPGKQVVVVDHARSLSLVRKTLRRLIDSSKAKVAAVFGRAV